MPRSPHHSGAGKSPPPVSSRSGGGGGSSRGHISAPGNVSSGQMSSLSRARPPAMPSASSSGRSHRPVSPLHSSSSGHHHMDAKAHHHRRAAVAAPGNGSSAVAVSSGGIVEKTRSIPLEQDLKHLGKRSKKQAVPEDPRLKVRPPEPQTVAVAAVRAAEVDDEPPSKKHKTKSQDKVGELVKLIRSLIDCSTQSIMSGS